MSMKRLWMSGIVIVLAGACGASAATLNGQWLLDDVAGGTATDLSSQGDDGAYTGSVITQVESPDLWIMAADFEQAGGGQARVTDLNTNENIRDIVNDLTITAWIKPDALTGKQRVLSRVVGGNGIGFGLNGSELLYTTYGAADNTSSGAALVAGGWRHIAVTHAPNGDIRYYVNGVLLTAAGNADNSTGTSGNPGFAYQISGLGTIELFDGALSDVRVYQGQLTGVEIQAAATVPNLFAYYALDETTGAAAHDSSGYHAAGNLGGTIQGETVINQTASAPAYGSATRFDGVNDEIFLGANATRQNELKALTSNFTIAAWINPDDTNGIQRVFSQDSISGDGWGFGLNGDDLRFTAYSVKDYDIAANVVAGQWSHIAVVFDASFDATFYLNGVLLGTVAGSQAADLGTKNWFIGSTGRQEYFAGLIDEVRIYDTALTADQIYAIATVPAPAALPAGLLLLGLIATRRRRGENV
jgi:hypothetical protein